MTVGVTSPYTGGQDEQVGLTFTDAASVELSTNTAEATAEVAVCRAKPGAVQIGVVPRVTLLSPATRWCQCVTPRTQRDPRERDCAIVTLTPTRPGRVHLTEVSLSHQTDRSHLYRRGTDAVRLDVSVTAR